MDLPQSIMLDVSRVYVSLAERVTGKPLVIPEDPEAEIIAVLRDTFGLVD